MVHDGNRLIVFGSQLIGVLIVIVGLFTQQADLRSPRPVGKKTPSPTESGQTGDRFARLWDDPLEGLLAFRVVEPESLRLRRKDRRPLLHPRRLLFKTSPRTLRQIRHRPLEHPRWTTAPGSEGTPASHTLCDRFRARHCWLSPVARLNLDPIVPTCRRFACLPKKVDRVFRDLQSRG